MQELCQIIKSHCLLCEFPVNLPQYSERPYPSVFISERFLLSLDFTTFLHFLLNVLLFAKLYDCSASIISETRIGRLCPCSVHNKKNYRSKVIAPAVFKL